jgi:hypothetical protein
MGAWVVPWKIKTNRVEGGSADAKWGWTSAEAPAQRS